MFVWHEKGHPLRFFWYVTHVILCVVFFACLYGWFHNDIATVESATPLTWTTSTPSGFTNIFASSTVMLRANDQYYAAFSDFQAGRDYLFVTMSADGASWSATTTVTSSVRSITNTEKYALRGLSQNPANGVLGLSFEKNHEIYYTTSTDGVSWSRPVMVVGSNETSGAGHFFDYSDSGVPAVVYRAVDSIKIATSSDESRWTTSTVKAPVDRILGFGFYQNELRAAYADSDQASYFYTTSSDYGMTWSPGRLIDISPLAFDNSGGFALDGNGNPGVAYFYSPDGVSSFNIRFATSSDGMQWTTSTIAVVDFQDSAETRTGVTFIGTKPYILTSNVWAPAGTNLISVTLSTSSAWSTTVIDNRVGYQYTQAITTDGDSQVVAIYPEESDGGKITFGRAMTIAAPSVSTPAITLPTDGSGIFSINTIVTDDDNDTTSLVVQFSTTTASGPWQNMTFRDVTPSIGSVTTSTGTISDIATDQNGNVDLTMLWDSHADLVNVSTTAYIRLIPSDLSLQGGAVVTSGFTVDTVAPDQPTTMIATAASSSVALSWDTIVGASRYRVSTSGLVATTTATSTVLTSLQPNTIYTIDVRALDQAGNQSSATSTSVFTVAAAPLALAAVAVSDHEADITWNKNGNPAGTVYEISNSVTAAVEHTTLSSYRVDYLNPSTAYIFRVRAQNRWSPGTYSDITEAPAITTPAAAIGAPVAVALPLQLPVPVAQPTPPVEVSNHYDVAVPTALVIADTSHTVTVQEVATNTVVIVLQSDPITLALVKDQSKDVDTDSDGINDIRVTYQGLINGKAQIAFVPLIDATQQNQPISINAGAYTTSQREVTLHLTVPGAVQVALSNTKDFAKVSFQSFQSSFPWNLTRGSGEKTVYARFRTASGVTADSSDTIVLEGQSQGECALEESQAYKVTGNPEVFFVTESCTKRSFVSQQVYFSYFDSWDAVTLTEAALLDQVSLDQIPFMPWGSRYTLAQPSLVKLLHDPRVYLVYRLQKFFIPSAAIFDTLGFDWRKIIDVADASLSRFTSGPDLTTVEARDAILNATP